MENSLEKIILILEVHNSAHSLYPVTTGGAAEMEIINSIATELLKEMGEIEQYDNVRKALINMFFAGKILNKNHD